MPTKEALQEQFDQQKEAFASIAVSQENLAGDIQSLTDRLAEGEVSAEILAEAQGITDRAKAVAAALTELAAKTPESTEEPSEEEPTEPTEEEEA